MDYDLLIFAIGMLATGAIFFGYPIGLRHGAKTVADEQCERLEAQTPTVVRNARRRLEAGTQAPLPAPPTSGGIRSHRHDVLNAEVIE